MDPKGAELNQSEREAARADIWEGAGIAAISQHDVSTAVCVVSESRKEAKVIPQGWSTVCFRR